MDRPFLFGLLVFFSFSWTGNAADKPAVSGVAQIIEKVNVVDARLKGLAWKPATVGTELTTGERLRTGEFSRAALRFTDLSVLRVDELTDMEILPPLRAGGKGTPDVKRGGMYFFSREKGGEMQIRTPAANGALRGTEIAVQVAADGRTTMTVLEGEVEMSNAQGSVLLKNGEQGEATAGRAPRKTAMIEAINIIQWCLYYPGVIDPAELPLTAAERKRLAGSLSAYREGDLLGAFKSSAHGGDASEGARLYRAAMMLSTGQVEKARGELRRCRADQPLRRALEEMIEAVQFKDFPRGSAPTTASGWMAESYHRQSRGDLEAALEAARKAVRQSPEFGFAWVRVAELLFSAGKTQDAKKALERGVQLSPRNAKAHALQGFLQSAENRIGTARTSFEQAIALDGALGDAWLGRGLTLIRQGREQEGRADLQAAAAMEPNRSILRSYLGKAFSQVGNASKANREFERAKQIDNADPTPWLYSAIQRKQENRYNQAVDDLERSLDLNDNRRTYRSRFLLDPDRAVRGANLASIYLNAGLKEQSVREAVRAVASDPSSAPAHLFLANSYNALRDPNRINLRYETAWFNEVLLSNLLSPVGGGPLSQFVSVQEYSKMFEKDGVGMSSLFEYLSTGQVRETASQYGTVGNLSYSLDADYQYNRGVRLNNRLSRFEGYGTFKLQLSPQDSVFLQTKFGNLSTGDIFQRYDQSDVDSVVVDALDDLGEKIKIRIPNRNAQTFRQSEKQDPGALLLGWHHEWSPGNHTLLLLGRLATRQTFSASSIGVPVVIRDVSELAPAGWDVDVGSTIPRDAAFFQAARALVGAGDILGSYGATFDLDYRSTFETYGAEAQQILTLGPNNILFGGRYQSGRFHTRALLNNYNNGSRPGEATFVDDPPSFQDSSVDFERVNLYFYDTWKVTRWLTLTGGVTYDSLDYPENFRGPPINDRQARISKVSPKAGIIVQPWSGATVRAAYSEAISGASFDESVRLEPTQVAGFVQSYRSLASESIVGAVSGSKLRIAGVSFEQKLPSRLYFAVGFEKLDQSFDRTAGTFEQLNDFGVTLGYLPSSQAEKNHYREEILTATINKLVGQNWSLGARYTYTKSDLEREIPALTRALAVSQDSGQVDGLARASKTRAQSGLHALSLYALYNHPCGFFARGEANYYRQANADHVLSATLSEPDADGMSFPIITSTNQGLPGANFWQFNVLAGYRFYRNQCEVSCGVLNLTNQDYRLSPLNPYDELPRERTFVVRCKLSF